MRTSLELQDNPFKQLSFVERYANTKLYNKGKVKNYISIIDLLNTILKDKKKIGSNPTLEDLNKFLENTAEF